MCGILGYIGRRSFDAEAFGRALDLMERRGPDDRGIFEEPEVLLGVRRLAILDLTPAGHQPMVSHDGR
jgi:asparagine synthase (glutamine-hydrolysing)